MEERTMITIPLGYVCIAQAQFEAMQTEIYKNQELFDNLVAYIGNDTGYKDIDPIRRLLGMEDEIDD